MNRLVSLMERVVVTGLVFLLGPTVMQLCAEPIELKVSDGGNGHFYDLILEVGRSWPDSQASAQSMVFRGIPGHLATLTFQAENDFIEANFPNDFDGTSWVWLGGFQDTSAPDFAEPDSGWRWITGEPWDFTNWHAGEPNNLPLPGTTGGEDYLTLFAAYKWNDLQVEVFDTQGFYVEFPIPEPSTGVISCVGLALLVTCARRLISS